MLTILKRRFVRNRTERDPLEIRDLLEYPQLRAVMGLEPLSGTTCLPPFPPPGRSLSPATTLPAPMTVSRTAA